MQAEVVSDVIVPSLQVRAEREKRLLESCDDRTPVEQLVDVMAAARMAYYRPDAHPSLRQDIICLCCGSLYRPDDVMDGENIFLCGSCILTRKESGEDGKLQCR